MLFRSDEDGHRQRVSEKGRQHEDEQPDDEMERDALGDHQVRQVVDAVDDEEEREQRDAEEEGRDQLAKDVPIDHRDGWRPHRSVVP